MLKVTGPTVERSSSSWSDVSVLLLKVTGPTVERSGSSWSDVSVLLGAGTDFENPARRTYCIVII